MKSLTGLSFVVLFFLLAYVTSFATPASRNLLDSIEITNAEGKTVIEIKFKQALAYSWHHPKSKGRSLTIGLKQLTNRDEQAGFRESISNISGFDKLTETIMTKEVDKEPVLIVDFSQELAYEVIHEGDFRRLFIIIFDDVPGTEPENTATKEQV